MNSVLSVPTTEYLDLGYRTDICVLTVRWLRAVTLAELQAGFEQARQQALSTRATRWLVDVRRRTELEAASSAWVAEELLPAVAQEVLPATLRVAYLLSPAREVVLRTDEAMRATTARAQSPQQVYRLRTFLDEGPAMNWLLA